MTVLRKIIFRLLLVTSPFWVFCCYLEFRLSSIENSYSYKFNAFNIAKEKTEVLILGNSEMLKGLNPSYISSKGFNMAHVSQTYSIDEKILATYLDSMPNLHAVILGLSYLSFGENLETGEESWRTAFYEKEYKLNLNQGFDMKKYSAIFRYTPYESLKIFLSGFNTNLTKGFQPNGYLLVPANEQGSLADSNAQARATAHTAGLKVSNMKKSTEALGQIIQMLAQKNISLWLVTPPLMENYKNHLNDKWVSENQHLLDSMIKNNTPKIFVVSPETTNYTAFAESDFSDVNHLNESGAQKFTLFIDSVIKNQVPR